MANCSLPLNNLRYFSYVLTKQLILNQLSYPLRSNKRCAGSSKPCRFEANLGRQICATLLRSILAPIRRIKQAGIPGYALQNQQMALGDYLKRLRSTIPPRGMFQFGYARLATCYVSDFFRNLSVRSHAVLAQAAWYTSGRASFMKA